MTVCIGVLCDWGKTLVAVSDNKIGFNNLFSADYAALKTLPIWRSNTVMVAGDDVSHADPVLERAYGLLSEGWNAKKKFSSRRRPIESRIVADALHDAYQWRLTQQIESLILKRRGYTVESFLRDGKKQIPDTEYSQLCKRIDSVTLDKLTLLLGGFDPNGKGHLWVIDQDSGQPRCHDRLGMAAIGTGAYAAFSMLSYYTDNRMVRYPYVPLSRGLYCALTAKFMAESADGVGKGTFLVVFRKRKSARDRGHVRVLDDAQIDQVRERWQKEGAPRLPDFKFVDETVASLLRGIDQAD